MLKAHEINTIIKEEKSFGGVSQEESDRIWEEKLKKAQERKINRIKTQEDIIKETQDKIAKRIEERNSATD